MDLVSPWDSQVYEKEGEKIDKVLYCMYCTVL